MSTNRLSADTDPTSCSTHSAFHLKLDPYDVIVLVNCPPPVGFFLYPGRPSLMHRPDADVLTLSRHDQDAAHSLQALARELDGPMLIDVHFAE